MDAGFQTRTQKDVLEKAFVHAGRIPLAPFPETEYFSQCSAGSDF